MAVGPSIDLSGWFGRAAGAGESRSAGGMVRTFAEALTGAEADAICGASYRKRSDERVTKRNGYRAREWDTRAGTIELALPIGSCFSYPRCSVIFSLNAVSSTVSVSCLSRPTLAT
jgi:hypothetical protein